MKKTNIKELVYGVDFGNIPKPNQESEKQQIERILLEEYEFPCDAKIFTLVLPPLTRNWIQNIRYNLRRLIQNSNGQIKYDQLEVTADSMFTDRYFEIRPKLSERFKDFGIRWIYYKSKDA